MAVSDTIRAEKKDISYYQNDELNYSFYVVDRESGAAVDVSGDVIYMHVKKKRTDPTTKAVAVLSTVAGNLVVSGAEGNIITLTGEYDLGQDDYCFDIDDITIKETIRFGLFKVTGDVTRL